MWSARSKSKLLAFFVDLGILSPTEATEVEAEREARPDWSTMDLIVDLGIRTEDEIQDATKAAIEKGGEQAVLRDLFVRAEKRAAETETGARALADVADRISGR